MTFKGFFIIHNDHDVPRGLVQTALSRIDSEEKEGSDIVDFHRFIGFDELVEVTEDEEFYEQVRDRRKYPSRFVKNRLPLPATKLAVVWQRREDDVIRVITAYYTTTDDTNIPDEPGNILRKINNGHNITKEEINASYEFWSRHAFVESIPRIYAIER